MSSILLDEGFVALDGKFGVSDFINGQRNQYITLASSLHSLRLVPYPEATKMFAQILFLTCMSTKNEAKVSGDTK